MNKTAAVVASAAATLLVLLPCAPARAERPRLAVMELAAPKVAPDLRQRATRAVQEGLLASGADVVEGIPAAATGPGGAPCDGTGCITAVARAALAGHVVRGTLDIEGRTYGLRLELLDGKTGDLVESREDRCEICTEGEALEMAGVSASALKVAAFKKLSATSAAPPPAAPPPAPAPRAPEASLVAPAPEAKPDHRAYGWIGVGAGVATIATGIVLFVLDGQGTCGGPGTCPERYKTQNVGIATFAGGVAVTLGGLLMLKGKF
jgi:hypothetical protein